MIKHGQIRFAKALKIEESFEKQWKKPKKAKLVNIFKGALGDLRSIPDPPKQFYSLKNSEWWKVKKFQQFLFPKIFHESDFTEERAWSAPPHI